MACTPTKSTPYSSTVIPNAPEAGAADTANDSDYFVTVTFACPRMEHAHYQELADQFHALHPAIRISLVAVEDIVQYDANYDHLAATRKIVSAADAAEWRAQPLATREGLFLDLSPFFFADAALNVEDFYPAMLEKVQWDGGLWALPTEATLTLLYYDKTAFDRAGIIYPEMGWSRETFLKTAQDLTLRKDAEILQYGFVDLGGGLLSATVSGQVNSVLDHVGSVTPPDITSRDVAAAVQWYVDLALRFGIMPNATTLGNDDNQHARMLTTLVHGDLADSQDRACWAWFTFLARQTLPVRGVPAQPRYLAADELAKSGGESRQDAYLALLSYEPFPAVGSDEFRSQWGHFERAIGRILQEGIPVEAALANAQQEAQ